MTGIHWRTTERGYLVGEFRDVDGEPGIISQVHDHGRTVREALGLGKAGK